MVLSRGMDTAQMRNGNGHGHGYGYGHGHSQAWCYHGRRHGYDHDLTESMDMETCAGV